MTACIAYSKRGWKGSLSVSVGNLENVAGKGGNAKSINPKILEHILLSVNIWNTYEFEMIGNDTLYMGIILDS